MRKAIFREELCKGCELCRHVCPRGLIKMSDGINDMGYHPATMTEEEKCTGCASCALMCPDLAIRVERS